ncbi:unnamed protein product [Ilex paraguariensis]|uniref:Uncharacterized protein n=1 Tax=Ilex paraguariensis TaxID=185542 RepID=A0ABC8RTE3_9AQUA
MQRRLYRGGGPIYEREGEPPTFMGVGGQNYFGQRVGISPEGEEKLEFSAGGCSLGRGCLSVWRIYQTRIDPSDQPVKYVNRVSANPIKSEIWAFCPKREPYTCTRFSRVSVTLPESPKPGIVSFCHYLMVFL